MKVEVYRILRIQRSYIREFLCCLDTNNIDDLMILMDEVKYEKEIEIKEVEE